MNPASTPTYRAPATSSQAREAKTLEAKTRASNPTAPAQATSPLAHEKKILG
jgi:hypothetical protein